jgi:hypothetical protein
MLLALLICTIYGFLSTSTPNEIGPAEVGIAGLLILMIGVRGAIFTFILLPRTGAPVLIKAMAVYLIVVPTIVGLIFLQNSLADYIRDIIPMLYALLPVFLYPQLKKNPELWLTTLIAGLFIAGIGFTVQYYRDPSIVINNLIDSQSYGENRDNPWQDPATVFAFAFSLCAAIYSMSRAAFVASSAFVLAYSLMMVMYLSTVSRAPIALSLLAGVATAFFTFRFSTGTGRLGFVLVLCVFGVALAMLLSSSVERLLSGVQMLFEKTERSGLLNARDLELSTVLDNASNLFPLIFGEGWGGLLKNPIYGGAGIRFVHNSFAYFLFKAGIFGILFYVVYLGWCLRGYRYSLQSAKYGEWKSILLIAAMPVVFVSVMLEPMFKASSFGFLISMLLAAHLSFKNSQIRIASA